MNATEFSLARPAVGNEDCLMLKLLHRIRQLFRRRPPAADLTVIEYEAVSLIAYEGRAAYQPSERGSRRSTVSVAGARQAAGSGQR
jgi:hypothetical protein